MFVSEWDERANETYRANFGDAIDIAGDVRAVDAGAVPDFDICLAGFPCQAFSAAGSRRGFDDDYKGMARGTLFFDLARICEARRPKVIFCENVKGLPIHKKGKTFAVIVGTLEQMGYKVFHRILNSRDFGVPQNRERIYIVAFREDVAPEEFEFPEGAGSPCVIRDIMDEAPVPARYYLSETYLATLERHRARHEAAGNGFGYVVRGLDEVAGAIVCGGMGRERNLIVDAREHSMTPTTNVKGPLNDRDIRKMTPREWARLQGYPDTFRLPLADTHLYKQLGNSVTVPVIRAIAERVRDVLRERDRG